VHIVEPKKICQEGPFPQVFLTNSLVGGFADVSEPEVSSGDNCEFSLPTGDSDGRVVVGALGFVVKCRNGERKLANTRQFP